MANILDHEMVPKHEVLTVNEKQVVLDKFRVKEKRLPRISASDPVVKVLNTKPGNLVRITRKSPTAGETIYYRMVTED